MTAHWWIFKNYTVCGTSSAFAVVLLALEELAMYLFQTTTLTIMNRALNFLGLIVFFALKLSRKVKACSLAENRPADIIFTTQTDVKSMLRINFRVVILREDFLCQILSTCLHNRISIANCRTAKAD